LKHYGIICPPVRGHLNPFLALARELQGRGHRVTVFHTADVASSVHAEQVDFVPLGERDHPTGSLAQSLAELGQLSGLAALRFTVRAIAQTTEMICRDAPQAVHDARVDMLLVDQTEPAGGSVAEHLGIPFVTLCNALALNREPDVPPPFSPWSYRESVWARMRTRLGYAVSDRILAPVRGVLGDYRRRWNLPAHKGSEDSYSQLAQISQQPREFDFPRKFLPSCFHYVGPLRSPERHIVKFPWERLDGRPLIYASLGTLQSLKTNLFQCFVEACADLDVQLVIAGRGPESFGPLPENVIAAAYAPQLELLKKASLTLTHGGLNTVLDSLSCGVPMVLVPLTYEQPAIAVRVARIGAGEILPLSRVSPDGLRTEIGKVTAVEVYRVNARGMAASIRTAGGVVRAADIIENAQKPSKISDLRKY
jgi:zeaxanthin glucosyltransferase